MLLPRRWQSRDQGNPPYPLSLSPHAILTSGGHEGFPSYYAGLVGRPNSPSDGEALGLSIPEPEDLGQTAAQVVAS